MFSQTCVKNQEFCPGGGGHAWQGVMHDKGFAWGSVWWGAACVAGRHALQGVCMVACVCGRGMHGKEGGMHGKGVSMVLACMVGGMHGQGHA